MLSGAKEIADVVEIVELTDGARHEFGDLDLRAVAVRHSMPTFGLRASHAGTTLGYPSDSGPCPGVDALARGADLFLCETFLSLPSCDRPAQHAGGRRKAAAAGGARRLVLTHLHPDADPARPSRGPPPSSPGLSRSPSRAGFSRSIRVIPDFRHVILR
jgi:ribonuclease BN (tRNA processing enzyme)